MFRHVPGENGGGKPLDDLFNPSERIAKLVRLLASDRDGEALSAARALGRTLAGFGGLNHLGDLIETHWHPPVAPKPEPEPIKPDWHVLAARLLKYPEILLGSRERSFLHNMQRSRTAPTTAQWKWLHDIEARLERRKAS
jgi:hypothetical protein